MNLKRDLPHIPFAEDFWGFANAGAQLADLHVNYESVPKYDKLKDIETPDMQINWRVEKMKLSKDKTQLKYNGLPHNRRHPEQKPMTTGLGTRSALEWIIDQYRVKVDRRSGIVNDPNRDKRTALYRRPHPPHHHRQPQNRRNHHSLTTIITHHLFSRSELCSRSFLDPLYNPTPLG